MKKKTKVCFISAQFGTDTHALEAALSNLGWAAQRLDDLQPSKSISASLIKKIFKADLVCAVFNHTIPNLNVIYEMGLAKGASIPVILLAEPSANIPFDFADFQFARVALTDKGNIEKVLSPLLKSEFNKRNERLSRAKSKIRKISETKARARLSDLLKDGAGRDFERFVADLFQEAGIQVSVMGAQRDSGVDIAMWIDELEYSLGNPILVEVKRTIREDSAKSLRERLAAHTHAAGLHCAVIISENKIADDQKPALPLQIYITFDELVDALAQGKFSKLLLDFRNRAVHGRV